VSVAPLDRVFGTVCIRICDPKQALLAALAPTNLAQRDLKCAGPIFRVIAAAKSLDIGELIGDRVAIGTS
jgi:hypothetical protein